MIDAAHNNIINSLTKNNLKVLAMASIIDTTATPNDRKIHAVPSDQSALAHSSSSSTAELHNSGVVDGNGVVLVTGREETDHEEAQPSRFFSRRCFNCRCLIICAFFLFSATSILLYGGVSMEIISWPWGEDWQNDGGLQSGPLVGHTTHKSTKLWILGGESLEITYRSSSSNASDSANDTRTMLLPPNAAYGASIMEIEGLESSTSYIYQVQLQNESVLVEGNFRTAPLPDQPAQFTYLLTSCIRFKTYSEQPVWDHILDEQGRPDFAILAGDTVYQNRADWGWTGNVLFDKVWRRNLVQRRETSFARFIRSVPTYATWDDHDYGQNGADRHQDGKEHSLRAFENLWANPSYGTPQAKGVYYSYYWGDVHFMVMDCRWNRDRSTGSQFGEDQNKWLYGELRNSQAPFKIIVNGAGMMEKGFSEDLKRLGKVVTEHSISGVLFNTGDIHRNEFKVKKSYGEWPYPVTQITSSGIANTAWRRPFALIHVDTKVSDPEITVRFFEADNRDDVTTWSNNPNVSCSQDLGMGNRHHQCSETIRLSDLTPSP